MIDQGRCGFHIDKTPLSFFLISSGGLALIHAFGHFLECNLRFGHPKQFKDFLLIDALTTFWEQLEDYVADLWIVLICTLHIAYVCV